MTTPSRRVAFLLALAGGKQRGVLPVMPWAVHAQSDMAAPSNLNAQSAVVRLLPERDPPTEGAGSVAGYEILRRPTDIRDPGNLPSIVVDTRSSPTGHGAITITLPATTDCNATGTICTDDGRKLSHATSVRRRMSPSPVSARSRLAILR